MTYAAAARHGYSLVRQSSLAPLVVPPAMALAVFFALSASLNSSLPIPRSARDLLVETVPMASIPAKVARSFALPASVAERIPARRSSGFLGRSARAVASQGAAEAADRVYGAFPSLRPAAPRAARIEAAPPVLLGRLADAAHRIAKPLITVSPTVTPGGSAVRALLESGRSLASRLVDRVGGATPAMGPPAIALQPPPAAVGEARRPPNPPDPQPRLAALPLPASPLAQPEKSGALPGYDAFTAVYEIASHTVYLPGGLRLEAHSGLGENLDNPRSVSLRMRGSTPPHLYSIEPLKQLFHGVRALRLTPIGDGTMFGRDGILAHTYMLGPRGDSNGCVVFKNYRSFLEAFDGGRIKRLAVVTRL